MLAALAGETATDAGLKCLSQHTGGYDEHRFCGQDRISSSQLRNGCTWNKETRDKMIAAQILIAQSTIHLAQRHCRLRNSNHTTKSIGPQHESYKKHGVILNLLRTPQQVRSFKSGARITGIHNWRAERTSRHFGWRLAKCCVSNHLHDEGCQVRAKGKWYFQSCT